MTFLLATAREDIAGYVRALIEVYVILIIAYILMTLFLQFGGRYLASLFMTRALRNESRDHYIDFARITAWLALSGVFWIAGGLREDLRLPL